MVASETSVAERGTERPHDITNVGGTLPADSSIRRVLFDSPCTSGSDLYTNSPATTSSHHTIDSLASDVFEPESILDRRDKGDGTPQYLVHWKGCEHSEDTWEPLENLQRCLELVEPVDQAIDHGRTRMTIEQAQEFHQHSISAPARKSTRQS